jgi:hypothetical protein
LRIKITEPGWAGFSDWLGAVQFKDGISVRELIPAELNNISSSLRVERYVEGEEGSQVGLAVNAVTIRDIYVEPEPQCKVYDQPIPLAGGNPNTRGEMPCKPPIMTDEQLEKIADEKGIAGLREIATQWGVKGRAIGDLLISIRRAMQVAEVEERAKAESGA